MTLTIDRDWELASSGLLVPPRPRRTYTRPVAIDLFAGAGGFSCGFHQAGWHVVAAVEYEIDAALTYMVNLARPGVRIHCDTPERERQVEKILQAKFDLDRTPGRLAHPWVTGSGWIAGESGPGCEHFFLGDIRAFTGRQILDAIGLDVGDVGCVFGGPPCQGFSAAGKRDVMDPRNSLVFEFTRLVCEIRPRTIAMENVPRMVSMTTPEGIPVLDAIALALDDGGYGEYDALRKALAGRPEVGAATRKTLTGKRSKHDQDDQAHEDDRQEPLFALDGDA